MHHTSSEMELEIMLSFSMYSFPAPAKSRNLAQGSRYASQNSITNKLPFHQNLTRKLRCLQLARKILIDNISNSVYDNKTFIRQCIDRIIRLLLDPVACYWTALSV